MLGSRGAVMRSSTVTIDQVRQSRSLVITRTEAAGALGVDPRTVTAGIDNGTIPAVKLGRRVVIPREKFLRLFDPDRD
jgi:excisionase family DNA binding protein